MIEPLSQLDHLLVWIDDGRRSCADNLAVDEALLDAAETPILRYYQWQGDALTLGYFQRWRELPFAERAEATTPTTASPSPFSDAADIARRWTGGGMVDHRGDRPYSLIVPAGHPLAAMAPSDSYRWIHRRLAQALTSSTALEATATELARSSTQPAMACFEAPVAWDVVDASSQGKLAGAAQRRSRGRLLHQGSVMIGDSGGVAEMSSASPAPARWREAFADALAHGNVARWEPGSEVLQQAADLSATRYSTAAWLERF